jgi:lipopolysaccharide biosynthesis regulator YciM
VSEIAYSAIVNELTRSPALTDCIAKFIANNDVLARLIDVDSLDSRGPAERAQALERIASALRTLALSSARYRCGNCGYGTQKFIWHCPSCKLWETIRPIQRFQLEATIR